MVQREESRAVAPFDLEPSRLKIGIVVSLFNSDVTERLLAGAREELARLAVPDRNVREVRVPGSFEIPLAARVLIRTACPDAVVCLGALIQGETDHYHYLAAEVSRGIGQVGLDTEVPIAFGVLTARSLDQAIERAGGRHGNKGVEAVRAALQMVQVMEELKPG